MSKLPVPKKAKPVRNKLSADESAALDDFCNEFEVEEVAFEKWHNSHKDLNIIIPLFVSLGESQKGGSKDLKFSREVINSAGEIRREKTCVTIAIPEIVKDGEQLILSGLGSVQETNSGDLVVIIHIK